MENKPADKGTRKTHRKTSKRNAEKVKENMSNNKIDSQKICRAIGWVFVGICCISFLASHFTTGNYNPEGEEGLCGIATVAGIIAGILYPFGGHI